MNGELRRELYRRDSGVLRVILHDAPFCTKSITDFI